MQVCDGVGNSPMYMCVSVWGRGWCVMNEYHNYQLT